MRRLATLVAMNLGSLILVGFLAALATIAGVFLILAGEAASAVALITAAVVGPITYLTGRAQGLKIGQNGGKVRRRDR